VGFEPTNPDVDVGDGRWVHGLRRHSKVEREHDDARCGKSTRGPGIVEAIARGPRTAVDVDDGGKRTVALRLVETCEERNLAVAVELDVALSQRV
jgi:hypothetical protein